MTHSTGSDESPWAIDFVPVISVIVRFLNLLQDFKLSCWISFGLYSSSWNSYSTKPRCVLQLTWELYMVSRNKNWRVSITAAKIWNSWNSWNSPEKITLLTVLWLHPQRQLTWKEDLHTTWNTILRQWPEIDQCFGFLPFVFLIKSHLGIHCWSDSTLAWKEVIYQLERANQEPVFRYSDQSFTYRLGETWLYLGRSRTISRKLSPQLIAVDVLNQFTSHEKFGVSTPHPINGLIPYSELFTNKHQYFPLTS